MLKRLARLLLISLVTDTGENNLQLLKQVLK